MKFAQPWAFMALALIPLLFILNYRLRQKRMQQLRTAGDLPLLSRMILGGHQQGNLFWLQTTIFAAGLGLVTLALARPQFGMRSEVRKGRGMDIVVALDLSKSMYAQDVVPSRLARARIELSALIDGLKGDRVGLLGFTSLGLPLCPLTVDHTALKLQLRDASPEDMPKGGTSLGEAINGAVSMLESAGHQEAAKAIVLLTDGEDHQGEAVKAAESAQEKGIEIHVVGVGSRIGEPIPLINKQGKVEGYVKDRSGRTVVSRLNEKMLNELASAGGGLTALPQGNGGLNLAPVINHLASLKKAELSDRTIRVYEERYQWALVPAFLLLLLASLLRPTRRAKALTITLGGWLLLYSPLVEAQSSPFQRAEPETQAGNDALAAGQAEEAVKAYEKAQKKLGADPRLLYNQGLANVAQGELEAAMSSFRQAAQGGQDPSLRARAQFALGNALRKLKKYDEAAKAYREALMEDPKLSGARRNLEIAQRQKAIQAAQPKDPNSPKDDQGGDPPPDQPDAGTNDGGSPDAGTGDGGNEQANADGGSQGDGGQDQQEQQNQQNGGADAGTPPDSGSSSNSSGEDAGAGEDGGGTPPSSGPDAGSEEPAQPQQPEQGELSQQDAEELLDALQEQEKALKRKKLLKRFRGHHVEKDW